MNGIVMLTVNGMLIFYKHKLAILRLQNCYEYARQVTCDSRCFTVNIPNIHCKTAIFPVRDTGLIERCTLLEDEDDSPTRPLFICTAQCLVIFSVCRGRNNVAL